MVSAIFYFTLQCYCTVLHDYSWHDKPYFFVFQVFYFYILYIIFNFQNLGRMYDPDPGVYGTAAPFGHPMGRTHPVQIRAREVPTGLKYRGRTLPGRWEQLGPVWDRAPPTTDCPDQSSSAPIKAHFISAFIKLKQTDLLSRSKAATKIFKKKYRYR